MIGGHSAIVRVVNSHKLPHVQNSHARHSDPTLGCHRRLHPLLANLGNIYLSTWHPNNRNETKTNLRIIDNSNSTSACQDQRQPKDCVAENSLLLFPLNNPRNEIAFEVEAKDFDLPVAWFDVLGSPVHASAKIRYPSMRWE